MSSLICGSVAYDTIMTFDGRFREHILPDQIHMLNVSFLVPGMRREYGGCAGNIAYTLKMLGGDPIVMATVGQDANRICSTCATSDRHRPYPRAAGHVHRAGDDHDRSGQQPDHRLPPWRDGPVATEPGAGCAGRASARRWHRRAGQPRRHAAPCTAVRRAGIPFIFDLGQAMPLFNGEDLRQFVELASYVTVNDYEAQVMLSRTAWTSAEVAAKVRAFIVTHGERGASVFADGKQYAIPAVQAERVWSIPPVAATRSAVACSTASRTDWTGKPLAASLR
jgi:adenosine kinase